LISNLIETKVTDRKKKKARPGSNSNMKYAGLATTMFFSLFIMWKIGSQVDLYLKNEIEYFGLLFVILTLFAFFYKLYKELS
jgi:hypothetical protein